MAKASPDRSRKKQIELPDQTINLYVKHLPLGDISPEELPGLPIREFDPSVPTDTWVTLCIRRISYEQRGDAVALLEAFLLAHDFGLYPPMWVLESLAKAFRIYLRNEGSTPLADTLGINLGRGKSLFKKTAEDELTQQLALQLFYLRTLFCISVEHAAEMLEAKLEQYPVVNNTRWKHLKKTYRAKTLRDSYSKWKKSAHLEEIVTHPLHPDYKDHPWSKKQRKSFLASFPQESWQHLVKTTPRLKSLI